MMEMCCKHGSAASLLDINEPLFYAKCGIWIVRFQKFPQIWPKIDSNLRKFLKKKMVNIWPKVRPTSPAYPGGCKGSTHTHRSGAKTVKSACFGLIFIKFQHSAPRSTPLAVSMESCIRQWTWHMNPYKNQSWDPPRSWCFFFFFCELYGCFLNSVEETNHYNCVYFQGECISIYENFEWILSIWVKKISYQPHKFTGNCTPKQKWACFVLYFKIINSFFEK